MANATVTIVRLTGAGPSETTVSAANTRCNNADVAYTNESTNPITKPTVGTNYSYYGVLRLKCTANADGHLLDNLKVYSTGINSLGTGRDLFVKLTGSYTQAVNANQLAGTTSFFTYTGNNPLVMTGSTSGTGQFGQYLYIQHAIGTTALVGAGGQVPISFQYDEAL